MNTQNKMLCIKDNNCAMNENCALCGNWWVAPIGPAVFVEGTWRAVCDKCAQELQPEIYTALCDAQQAHEGRLQHDATQPDANPFAQEPPSWLRGNAPVFRPSWPDGPDRDTQLDALIDRLSMQADQIDLLIGRVYDLGERLSALAGMLQWKGQRDE